jgi:hypothetical protein
MAGIRLSKELREYTESEWRADVGYLVKEFEIQKELDKAKGMARSDINNKGPSVSGNHHLAWIFGKRHSPR